MVPLEGRIRNEMDLTNMQSCDQETLIDYLTILNAKHPPTCDHSCRVGILALKIGEYVETHGYPQVERKGLLFCGLAHDFGKSRVRQELLYKMSGLSPEEMDEIRTHAMCGHELLRGTYPFTSDVIVRVHRFQKDPYPNPVPPYNLHYGKKTCDLIQLYARLVALADFYDALNSRPNFRFSSHEHLTDGETKQILIAHNHDVEELLQNLYTASIFGNGFYESLNIQRKKEESSITPRL
jgi:response regulator RpfG family c-di-GMP phosphodiesterase